MRYWILIADAAGARVFSAIASKAPLHLERQIANPDGRARTQDLVTDEPGRYRKGAEPKSAMDPRTTAHEAVVEQFTRELVEMLDEEARRGNFDSLAIVAPPHLLGLLRSALTRQLTSRLKATLAKDLAHIGADQLRPHLTPVFTPGLFA
jgi:protein required for attachment to host cells